MEEQIKAEFEKSGFSLDQEDEILQKCHTFCINYKLSPSDLVSNWEVYYLNRQLSGFMVENAHMGGFQLYLQSEQKEITMKEESHLHIYSSNDVGMLLNEDQDDAKESFLDTPISQSNRQYLESNYSESTPGTNEKPSSGKVLRLTSNRITPFSQRANKFILQFTFNDQGADNTTKEQEDENPEDDVIRRVRPSERCSFQIQSLQPKSGCRFMYDRIEDRFNSLENRIRRHTTAYATFGQHGEPTDATLASQKSVFAVGMVCSDGEGRLNEKSVLLQGSVEHSGGQRVRLDLQKLVRFSLFPGQVIGIEGHNPSGHCLIASKVIDSLPISPDAGFPPAKKQVMDPEYQLDSSSNSSSVLSLIIAAGPFTTSDNLLFEPLAEIIAYASRKQPQLLILMGPFVDSEHPNIKNGTVDRSFDDIFDVEILRRLQDYMKYMGSSARVILMPSTRDANHDFVFPQPPFDINPLEEIKQQITCLANPSIFSANEITVGCSSVDILKQLSSEEISRVPADMPGERVGRLATHILNQLSFYPLFPPSLGVPLALSLAPEALEIDSIPQILILPSDLAPFVKVLSLGEREHAEETSRCICVNPGRLAKGIGGGTFVELNYNGNPDRTNASIVRI